jgi:hypothetical protein
MQAHHHPQLATIPNSTPFQKGRSTEDDPKSILVECSAIEEDQNKVQSFMRKTCRAEAADQHLPMLNQLVDTSLTQKFFKDRAPQEQWRLKTILPANMS